MPEGHTVHRTANQFNEFFAGKPIIVASPQGRFSESAQLISGRNLQEARAIGKQMFLLFQELKVEENLPQVGEEEKYLWLRV